MLLLEQRLLTSQYVFYRTGIEVWGISYVYYRGTNCTTNADCRSLCLVHRVHNRCKHKETNRSLRDMSGNRKKSGVDTKTRVMFLKYRNITLIGGVGLLPWKDSNPHRRNQNPTCYHYTTRQDVGRGCSRFAVQSYGVFFECANFFGDFFRGEGVFVYFCSVSAPESNMRGGRDVICYYEIQILTFSFFAFRSFHPFGSDGLRGGQSCAGSASGARGGFADGDGVYGRQQQLRVGGL